MASFSSLTSSSLAITEAMYANAILEALHLRATKRDSLAVTEAMYANAILEALHTSCDQARRAGDGRTIMIGASLSEPHIDGTTGRNHICITR